MINDGMFTSTTSEWETPQDLFNRLNDQYHFELDVAASKENAKCDQYITKEQNGLMTSWGTARVFCNPPYGRELAKWVEKCSKHPGLAVMLIPARTDTRWFHDFILYNPEAKVEFLKGRINFSGKDNAPFPSMVVVFHGARNPAEDIVICEGCKNWDQESGLTVRKCSEWGKYTKRREFCSRGCKFN